MLLDGSARIAIYFENYEIEERAIIVEHLRATLSLAVQTGWNLFAYKTALLEPRSVRMKPGPSEILFRRQRWDRYLVPSLVVAALGGIVAWRILGQPGFLAAPLFPLAAWALMRAITPAEGMIAKKLSSMITSDTDRFLPFLLLWFVVAIAGVIAQGVVRPGKRTLTRSLLSAAPSGSRFSCSRRGARTVASAAATARTPIWRRRCAEGH